MKTEVEEPQINPPEDQPEPEIEDKETKPTSESNVKVIAQFLFP